MHILSTMKLFSWEMMGFRVAELQTGQRLARD